MSQGVLKTLHQTKRILANSLIKLAERGETLAELDERAAMLEETSHHFVLQVVPWYTQWWMRTKECCANWLPFYYCCAYTNDKP